MNRSDVQTLLGAAAAIDNTVPAAGATVVTMWAAILDDVPAEIGQAAVRDYYRSDRYATHRNTITPGDIVAYHRRVRREQQDRAANAETQQRQQAVDAAPAPVRSLGELFALHQAERDGADQQQAAGQAAAHREALRRRCPHCGAQPGQRCTTYAGRALRQSVAHPARQQTDGKSA